MAAASQKVMPTQALSGPRPAASLKARVKIVGPRMPATLLNDTIAPCSRPCSFGATCRVISDCAAGVAMPDWRTALERYLKEPA